MELEDLTKSQLVLLAVLVSFVTSIATGIFTVSFLIGEPIAIHETVNKIVERTIEKQIAAPQDPVVLRVREAASNSNISVSENLSAIVAGVTPSLVEVQTLEGDERASGVVVSQEGIIVTLSRAVSESTGTAEVLFADGTKHLGKLLARNTLDDLAVIAIDATDHSPRPAPLALSDGPISSGQTLFALSAEDREALVFGAVTTLFSSTSATTSAPKTVFSGGAPRPGSPVITSRGTFLGLWGAGGRLISAEKVREIVEKSVPK